jgi:hypothetical protein
MRVDIHDRKEYLVPAGKDALTESNVELSSVIHSAPLLQRCAEDLSCRIMYVIHA